MKIFNKILFLLLTLGFLNLTAMHKDESHENEPITEDVQKPEQTKSLNNPYKLKTIAAYKTLDLIKSGKSKWGSLLVLPEGLARYVELFHIADVYMDDSIVQQSDSIEFKKLSGRISQAKELLFKLLESDSEHIETFIAALDDIFDYSIFEDKPFYTIIRSHNVDKLFEIIIVILTIILENDYIEKDLDNEELSPGMRLLLPVATNAADCKLVYLTKLFLDLNLFSRDVNIILFDSACCAHTSATVLKLLNNKINLTKNEFEYILVKNRAFYNSINGHLDIVEYLIELIEAFNLDIVKIINQKYKEWNTDSTALIKAVICGYLDIVQLLLAKGADANVKDMYGRDALFFAIKGYSEFDIAATYVHHDEEENKLDIAHQLSEMQSIIKVLEKALKKSC